MRAYFMKNLSTEQNVPAVYNYPIGGPQDKKDMHDPVGINSFECFGEVRKENTTRGRRLIKEVLNCEEVSLRLSKDVKERLSWMKITNKGRSKLRVGGTVDEPITGVRETEGAIVIGIITLISLGNKHQGLQRRSSLHM